MKIDYSQDSLLTEFSLRTLQDRYMVAGETSPQEAFARAAEAFADDDDHAQRLYDYASKLWFMFSTPVLSNGGTQRGMPISCFLNYVEDSREGITDHYTENAYLSSFGGGIGGSWSAVRSQGTSTSKGSESTGAIPFMKVVDSEMLAFSQGVTRRGSYAGYMHITHPEVEEFLDIRKPTGGDVNRKCTNLHHGVVINDKHIETILRQMLRKALIIDGEDTKFIQGDQVSFSEVSPRPHDTGMVTLISQDLSEFALHVRAILGLPVPNIRGRGAAASAVGGCDARRRMRGGR